MASVKTCTKCGAAKLLGEFCRRSDQKDGLSTVCRSCASIYKAQHRMKNLERIREHDAQRRNTVEYKERMKEYNAQYRHENRDKLRDYVRQRMTLPHVRSAHAKNTLQVKLRYPDRVKARHALNKAVVSGKVQKLPCMVCGEDKSEAHHTNYSDPLIVVWLCKDHHEQVHMEHEQNVASYE